MRRPNSDGTSRFMTRTDLLTNRTMFLIGRIALDKEHLVLYKLLYCLKQIPQAPTIHGCTNDCLYLRPALEDEVDGMPAEDHLAKQIENLIATHERLRFCKDGTPIFRVEKEKSATEADDVLVLWDAPDVRHRWQSARPKLSQWSAHGWTDDNELLEMKHEAEMEDKLKGLQDGQTFAQSFGNWSANGRFVLDKDWFDTNQRKSAGHLMTHSKKTWLNSLPRNKEVLYWAAVV